MKGRRIKSTFTTSKNLSMFRVIQTFLHYPFMPVLVIPLGLYFLLNLHIGFLENPITKR